MKEENEDSPRKPYETPQLHRVELTPEEIFAASCKTTSWTSPAATPCSANGCFTDGS